MTEGKTETGFLAMVERATRPENPDLEEEHRKNKYPEICSASCPNITCGYRTEENFGKPCQMRFEQYRTQEKDVEKLVDKLLEPLEQRLSQIENQAEYHVRQPQLRAFSGKRQRIDIGTNQERICNG